MSTLLGRKGVEEILVELRNGPKRFNQLARIRVERSKINRRTLSERLRELELAGLIIRSVQKARPPYPIYEITDNGKEVLDLIHEIRRRVKRAQR